MRICIGACRRSRVPGPYRTNEQQSVASRLRAPILRGLCKSVARKEPSMPNVSGQGTLRHVEDQASHTSGQFGDYAGIGAASAARQLIVAMPVVHFGVVQWMHAWAMAQTQTWTDVDMDRDNRAFSLGVWNQANSRLRE